MLSQSTDMLSLAVPVFEILVGLSLQLNSNYLNIANEQMMGRWESKSNINVSFRFMYSQKWNCAASLFPKQNYNVLSPNFTIHVSVSIGRPILEIYTSLTDTVHECRNCEQGKGHTVSFRGIHKSNFRHSVAVSIPFPTVANTLHSLPICTVYRAEV